MYKRRRAHRVAMRLLAALLAVSTLGSGVYAARRADLPGGVAYISSVLCAPHAALAATKQVVDSALTPAPVLVSAQPESTDGTAQALPALGAEQDDTAQPDTAQDARPAQSETPVDGATEDEPVPAGMVARQTTQYPQGSGAGYVQSGAATVRNCTQLSDADIAAEMMQALPFSVEIGNSEPQVLIMHTHATESYETEGRTWCDPDYSARSTDNSQNMIAVGAEIAAQLNAAGIATLQDTTLHDSPSYNGSYARSNETVSRYLEQYPSIKVVLDVHRDAIQRDDGTRVAPTATIDGQSAAQVMIICGADLDGNLPNFRQNLRFASRWQDAMERLYPGLTRPVLFDYRYYNQDLTTGSLLIEMGGHANTLEEAKYAGRLVGKALATLFYEEAGLA